MSGNVLTVFAAQAVVVRELEPVRRKLESMAPVNPQIHAVDRHYEAIVKRWMAKMARLGLVIKGLWLVDFVTGDGYLCWKFPELKIGQYHGYHEGYTARRPLREGRLRSSRAALGLDHRSQHRKTGGESRAPRTARLTSA